MTPTLSNTIDPSCSPVSSNCVIWQGRDVPCIDLCYGDSVSDVVYNLAEQICAFQKSIDLSDLDLSCLISACGNCPEPDKSLNAVLALIISKVCGLSQTPAIPPAPAADMINLATCFQTVDSTGNPVIKLPIDTYVYEIGVSLCTQINALNSLTSTVNSNTNRIATLENRPIPSFSIPNVTPVCTAPETPIPITQAYAALEQAFCNEQNILGLPTALAQALGKQCVGLDTSPAFSINGPMSSLPGWKNPVQSVADSLNNLWLTICDMRAGLIGLSSQIPVGCSSLTIGYTVTIQGSGSNLAAKVVFLGSVSIPDTFTDCPSPGSSFVITDKTGNNYTYPVNVSSLKNSANGVTIPLGGTSLNTASDFSFSLNSCLTDGKNVCQKSTIVSVPNPAACPVVTATPSATSIDYSFSNTGAIGTSYTIDLMNAAGTAVIASQNAVGSANPSTGTFSGLTAGTAYNIRVTINIGSTPHICPLQSVSTSSAVCNPPTNVSASIS